MRSLIAGNWKMHGAGGSLGEIAAVARWRSDNAPRAEVLICPPFTLISRAAEAAAGAVSIGGQDCHALISGAFTGEVSAEMLRDAGASAVIVGHSERRRYNGETDAMVAAKAEAAWRAGLLAIVCIGETEDEHDAGRAET
ncbi:MAG TPA: triose-phosphate isomerase, partial [Rhizomicrobium sp.]